VVVEAWELSPDFQFDVAGDGHLSEVLERIRKGSNLPALAAVSMTSTGVIELPATGLRAVGFLERVAGGHQQLIHLPGSRSQQSGHKSSRFTSEKATKLDSKLDYNPPFRLQSTRRNPP
jgi:hypothetical protein